MSVMHRLLTEHIDLWTAADTGPKSGRGRTSGNAGSVYGIKKLRELILELAMRGKLVLQDANDEPVSEILKQAKNEKFQLIANGTIRNERSIKPIVEGEISFELPLGWHQERLGNLAHLITKGTTPTSIGFSYQPTGIRFVKVENVSAGRINLNSIDQYISEEADNALSRSRLIPHDVLFSIAGTIGRTCIIYPEDTPANTNQAFAIIRGTKTVFDQMFLLRQLDSFVSNKTKEKARGGAMNNVSLSDLAELTLIIPPLAEQRRIVTKVDELMALCDQLETQHTNAADAHEQLVSHLLGTLTQSQSAADFSTNWQRIAAHFDTLFTTEASIDALKKTLLQLAVMGKLTPQNPEDEPASELLQRIQSEKIKLVAEGKIKQDKPLELITDDERPFEVPVGWLWVKCQDICLKITDGEHATPKRSESGLYLLSARNVTNDGIILNDVDYVPMDEFVRIRARCDPNIGDILISCSGSVGRVALVDKDNTYSMVRSAAMIRPNKTWLLKEYIAQLLRSTYVQNQIKSRSKQSAQANLFLGAISNLVLIIPPLAEQHRIVAKVDELIALCDALKTRITESSRLQQKLADVMVEQAVA